jgi:hypothetical protein
MNYESTVRFEVTDDVADLAELIGDHKIAISGAGLVGRTDDGEVESEWQMASVGVVEWSDDKQAKVAQATKDIRRRLELDEETAGQLCEWMSCVYDYMAARGLCATQAISR